MMAALTAGAITLVAAAAYGGRDASIAAEVAAPEDESPEAGPDATSGPSDDPEATSGPGVKTPAGGGPQATANPIIPTAPNIERRSTQGATREGIFKDHFELAIHAPVTFDGAPLPLAEDPVTGIKGYITYLNRQGGVNGLKARITITDDKYTTAGGRQAGDKIAKELKPFMIEGTLGIDQIHKVLLAAKGRDIPYFAGGGPEPEFKDLGMYQIISNYDQYVKGLADFLCSKHGKTFAGGPIRIGTTTLNSEFILPVEKRFIKLLSDRNCVVEPVDPDARGTVRKPTEQDTYTDQYIRLRNSYDGQGPNVLVPLQDPITTTRQTTEWPVAGRPFKWAFSNFAHDADLVLTLAKGQMQGAMGLSGACYYHPQGGAKPYDPKLCSKMGEAHRQWVALGSVTYDENAGGSGGGKSSFNYTEDSWTADGSGGAAGYQIVYFWHGAMKSIGTDPTREKFMAALKNYDKYSNVITGPITFKGSANTMVGAYKFVLLEAMSNLKYRQVTSVTPGLVDHF